MSVYLLNHLLALSGKNIKYHQSCSPLHSFFYFKFFHKNRGAYNSI